MLSVEHLCMAFPDGRRVLHDISFDLPRDQTLAVVGPSGCGKTTLLYLICGLLKPTEGHILLSGEPIERSGSEVSIVLQDFGLLPWKTVVDNVALGLKIQGAGRRERMEAASAQLLHMGLAGREQDFPGCLSGGERQRVALARSYAAGPRLLLMDEPFSSLDALTREKLQDTLVATWRSSHVPYILVTHSVEEAVLLGSRILLLSGRPASIAAGFDNPAFGQDGHRQSGEYFELVRELRRSMEKLW